MQDDHFTTPRYGVVTLYRRPNWYSRHILYEVPTGAPHRTSEQRSSADVRRLLLVMLAVNFHAEVEKRLTREGVHFLK